MGVNAPPLSADRIKKTFLKSHILFPQGWKLCQETKGFTYGWSHHMLTSIVFKKAPPISCRFDRYVEMHPVYIH